MEKPAIELKITSHVGQGNKWDYDYYGNRSLSDNYGTRYKYQHAKFRLPSGRPKCLRFMGDIPQDEILSQVQKKYSNYTFVLSKPETVK